MVENKTVTYLLFTPLIIIRLLANVNIKNGKFHETKRANVPNGS